MENKYIHDTKKNRIQVMKQANAKGRRFTATRLSLNYDIQSLENKRQALGLHRCHCSKTQTLQGLELFPADG
jgi:hypothetical protein